MQYMSGLQRGRNRPPRGRFYSLWRRYCDLRDL